MRLLLGAVLVLLGSAWIAILARRDPARTPARTAFDFLTGAPRDSVLAIGALLLGLLLVAAHFVGG